MITISYKAEMDSPLV